MSYTNKELVLHVRRHVEEKLLPDLAEKMSDAIADVLNQVDQIPDPPNMTPEEKNYFGTMKGLELGLGAVRTVSMILGSAEAHASIISDRTPETDIAHKNRWNEHLEATILESRILGREFAAKMLNAQLDSLQNILKNASKTQA